MKVFKQAFIREVDDMEARDEISYSKKVKLIDNHALEFAKKVAWQAWIFDVDSDCIESNRVHFEDWWSSQGKEEYK